MPGGQKGVRVEEQRSALGADAAGGIPIVEAMPALDVGDERLFVVYRYGDALPTPVNADQWVFDPALPDGGGYLVTLRDIISCFGEDAWAEFQKLTG